VAGIMIGDIAVPFERENDYINQRRVAWLHE
jgi:hypothetical protein